MPLERKKQNIFLCFVLFCFHISRMIIITANDYYDTTSSYTIICKMSIEIKDTHSSFKTINCNTSRGC